MSSSHCQARNLAILSSVLPKLPLKTDSMEQNKPHKNELTEAKLKTKLKKMSTIFLSNANTFLPSFPSSTSAAFYVIQKQSLRNPLTIGKALSNHESSLSPSVLSKRNLCISLSTTAFIFSLSGKEGFEANASILEADDDEELLEKVKKDRKKRLERRGVINSSAKEKEYLQDLVYKLSKVGEAIEKNDLSAASLVLGQNTDTDWIKKVKTAFDKLSSSPEEKTEVDTFNSSLASLITSVTKNDMQATKVAFVESATALETWTSLTGLAEQLKGL